MSSSAAVFVFAADGEVMVFGSPQEAEEWMEAVDVDNGEYVAAYTVEGRVMMLETRDNRVLLRISDSDDPAGLRGLLRERVDILRVAASPDDPVAVANELLRSEWEHRWPRRPRWLARRLHGDVPPQV